MEGADKSFKVSEIASTKVGKCPDYLEFCPREDLHHYLLCGHYQLDKEKQTKSGALTIFDTREGLSNVKAELSIDAGVFDLKWLDVKSTSHPRIVSADSQGRMELFSFKPEEGVEKTLSFDLKANADAEEDELSALYVDLDPQTHEKVAISTDKGGFYILSLQDAEEKGSSPEIVSTFNYHTMECWCVHFDRSDENVLYSGSDDMKFCRWDSRMPDFPTLANQDHQYGVTYIGSSWKDDNIMFTGSYDDHLYFWDKRNMSRRDGFLSKHDLGGGVWRIRQDAQREELFYVATMQSGFKIVEADPKADTLTGMRIIQDEEALKKGTLLGYGIDSLYTPGKEERLLATCSFYDYAISLHSITL